MGYAIVDGEVRFGRMLVDRAEAASFVPLGWGWGKDKACVYSYGCKVEGAKPKSFVALDAAFGRDAERVFGGAKALDADVATFRTLGGGYGVDKRHGYYGELRLGWLLACWTLETMDAATFATRAYGWAVDGAHAYCAGEAVPDADPETLNPLTRRLASDGKRVFAGRRVIDGADAATFRALDEHFGVDAKRAYFADVITNVIEVADRDTFRSLGDDFAEDHQYVYWHDNVLAGVAPQTMRPLSERFACTDTQVLYFYSGIHGTRRISGELHGTKPIVLEGADPTTFRDVGDLSGADAKRAWHHSARVGLRGEASRFESIGVRLARDDVAVYYENEVVPGAKPATFAIVAPAGVARDGKRWYRYNAYGDYPMIQESSADEARAILDGEGEDEGEYED